jgi:hypothetical protein
MNWLDQYYLNEKEGASDTRQGLLRGLNILRQPKYHVNQWKQFWKTIAHPSVDYSIDDTKRTVAILPGLSCSVPTYAALIDAITKDGGFNILKLEDFPEDFRAIYSRLSLTERAQLLLNTLEKHDKWPVDLIWHSIGWPVAAYAKILEDDRKKDLDWWDESKIGKIITLSAPMMGSVWLANLPVLPKWFKSVDELHPESSFMKRLSAEWNVDHRFITLRDEIIRGEEMNFRNGKEHELDHWHFDYMLGTPKVVADTASQIVQALDIK